MYFNSFPRINYDNKGNQEFKVAVNILRRVGIRTKIVSNLSLFDTYDVGEGDTPESVADFYYNNPELHWIILLANDIMDRYHDWPMSTPQFLSYINDIYSTPYATHHYEITQTSGDTTTTIDIGTDNTDYPSATVITNLEYEEAEQDKKRKIRLLDPAYIALFSEEYSKLMSESVF